MPGVKILAVEDDAIYAESLEMLIDELGYELTGIADNAADTLALLNKAIPDIILMDIEINDSMTGVELAARLKHKCNAPVIFVTSHTDKETFNKAKLTFPEAYIIKPYTKESLQAAIELALMKADMPAPVNIAPAVEHSFYVKDNGSLYKILTGDILYIEAEEKYCTIVTKQRKHTLNIRLKELLARLSPADFVQTHRAYIVRKDAIERIDLADQVVLVAGRQIPMGKSFKDELLNGFNYL